MKKEHVIIPGVVIETTNTKGKKTIERIVRDVMRECGYPCTHCDEPDCSGADLCATIAAAGCTLGGGGHVAATVVDSTTINFTASGTDNQTFTGSVILNPDTTNILQASPTGLQVLCETVQDCIGIYFGPGLQYNDSAASSIFQVRLSADAGNCLGFGTDTGLFLDCSTFGGAATAKNGVNITGGDVELGGNLLHDTSIDGQNLHDFEIVNAGRIFLETEGATAGRLSSLVLTDNLIVGAQLASHFDATRYSRLWLDPEANASFLSAINGTNEGNVVLSESAVSIGVDAGQGGRRLGADASGHTAENLDAVPAYPHTFKNVYYDPATDFLYHGEPFQASNAENGLSVNGTQSAVGLGGTLIQNTVVDTDTFSLRLEKGDLRFEIANTGLPLGTGPTARTIFNDGSVVGEIGLFGPGGGGVRYIGSRWFDSASGLDARAYHSAPTGNYIISQQATGTNITSITLDSRSVIFGNFDTTSVPLATIEIEDNTLGVGSPIVKILGLPASPVGLPANALYTTVIGADKVICVV